MKRVFNVESSLDPQREKLISTAIQEGFKRLGIVSHMMNLQFWLKETSCFLVEPMICRRVRRNLKHFAEGVSIDVFAKNLRNLLLTPPCVGQTIMGIDPGMFI